jgi:hypothetical protein
MNLTEAEVNANHPLARFSYRAELPYRREKFKSLTEGVRNDNDRRIVEVLCEQQLLHIRRAKQALTQGQPFSLDEASVSSADVAVFQKFALKIIPRVYPNLFIKDLVSIQPIPLPEAKVFYKDFKRDPAGTRLDTPTGDRTYADRGAELDPVAKVKMSLSSTTVTATTKALQYEFSQEFNQDLMAYHGLTADGELSVEAAREISQEIEQDIIYTLLTGAGAGNVNWSATPPVSDTKTIDIEAYNKTFYHAIVDARKLVFKKRYAYPNWLVTGPDVCARIEKLPGFVYDPTIQPYINGAGSISAAVGAKLLQGRQLFGTLNGVISIFVDPWFPMDNKAVLGYKGSTDFDVGLVYSPYIPFYATAPLETPGTLSVSRALMARQAVSMLVPEMYSTVTITGLS